ncbi:MAG: hypothetical protein KAU83_06825, partial [Bacteroidales bacterium]|nr:hypothetical protein [Bacteroidales bacterium]
CEVYSHYKQVHNRFIEIKKIMVYLKKKIARFRSCPVKFCCTKYFIGVTISTRAENMKLLFNHKTKSV